MERSNKLSRPSTISQETRPHFPVPNNTKDDNKLTVRCRLTDLTCLSKPAPVRLLRFLSRKQNNQARNLTDTGLNMDNTLYFRRGGSLPMLNMIAIVLLIVITTAQSQNTTTAAMTEAASTAAGSTHAPTVPAPPPMPVQKLVGSVSAREENGSRLTDLQNEMAALLVDSFNGTNSELAPIFQRIEVENVSFTVNFRLVLSKNVNGSDVNGTTAAAVLLGSLSESGMLGKFLVGDEGVYFWMPTIPEPTEPPFELPYWGPAVAIVSMVVVFVVLVIVAACYIRFKSDKSTLVRHEEEFDAEL
ncbi:uncharacterized protein LOC144859016 [Branchiostoma floridae x Branchiostoma japonicum]